MQVVAKKGRYGRYWPYLVGGPIVGAVGAGLDVQCDRVHLERSCDRLPDSRRREFFVTFCRVNLRRAM